MADRDMDNTEAFEHTMAELNAVACEAFNRGDAKACAKLYAPDATLLLPGRAPIEGRKSIEAFLGDSIAAGAKLVSVEAVKTDAAGDMGYSAGFYRFETPGDDGSTVSQKGQFITVFRRRPDGAWKAVCDSLISDAGAWEPIAWAAKNS